MHYSKWLKESLFYIRGVCRKWSTTDYLRTCRERELQGAQFCGHKTQQREWWQTTKPRQSMLIHMGWSTWYITIKHTRYEAKGHGSKYDNFSILSGYNPYYYITRIAIIPHKTACLLITTIWVFSTWLSLVNHWPKSRTKCLQELRLNCIF